MRMPLSVSVTSRSSPPRPFVFFTDFLRGIQFPAFGAKTPKMPNTGHLPRNSPPPFLPDLQDDRSFFKNPKEGTTHAQGTVTCWSFLRPLSRFFNLFPSVPGRKEQSILAGIHPAYNYLPILRPILPPHRPPSEWALSKDPHHHSPIATHSVSSPYFPFTSCIDFHRSRPGFLASARQGCPLRFNALIGLCSEQTPQRALPMSPPPYLLQTRLPTALFSPSRPHPPAHG